MRSLKAEMYSEMNAPKIDMSQCSPVFGWTEEKEVVYLRCPNGHVASLDHGINVLGVVSPSVKCPKCGFHESNLVLEGYLG